MSRRTGAVIVAMLTGLAAVLRVPGLNSGLWYSEIVTLVQSVRAPLDQLVTAFPGSNNHPLYSLIAHLSVRALGDQPWTLRLPALLFGVASVPLMYRLGLLVTTRLEALLATLLVAVTYHAVWFSQDARGYTALLCFTLLASELFLRLCDRPDYRIAVAYGIAMGLGIYTHLTMVFLGIAHASIWAWLAWSGAVDRRRLVGAAALALGIGAALGVVLYLPMLPGVYRTFSGPAKAAAAVATPKWAVVEMLRGLKVGLGTIGVLVVGALTLIGAVSYLRRNALATVGFILPGFVTAAALLALRSPIRPRFFFAFLGFGLLMLVRGAVASGRIVESRLGLRAATGAVAATSVVVLIGAVSIWSLQYNYRYPKQDFGGARAFVESHRQEIEPVVTSGLATYPYARFYRLPWPSIERAEQFDRLRAGSPRAWVVYSFPAYMDPALVERLQRSCMPEQRFPGTVGGGDVFVCTTRTGM